LSAATAAVAASTAAIWDRHLFVLQLRFTFVSPAKIYSPFYCAFCCVCFLLAITYENCCFAVFV